jgi:ubiquinone/menaquinone biosynthesis C-methylase UbiE
MLLKREDYQHFNEALASKSFFFSPVPMLLLDRDCTVVEINCALRELAKTDLTVCKGRPYEEFVDQISSNLLGSLISPTSIIHKLLPPSGNENGFSRLALEDLGVSETSCQYRTIHYGLAKLQTTEMPLVNTATGDIQGALLSIAIVDIERRVEFHKALRKRLRHELMWEIYAASYDRIQSELPFYQEVRQRHIDAMCPDAIQDILDIGAGTGNVTIELLKKSKRITAVDSSNAMLKKLYSKIDDSLSANLTIIEDTAEKLPLLNDNGFDGVTAQLAFFDMQNPFAALDEALRLLKPGGILIVTEPKSCFNVTELMSDAEEHLNKMGLMDRLKEDWIRIQTVAPHINQRIKEVQSSSDVARRPWNAEILFEILEQQGFASLSFEDSHLGNCATITGVKP